MTFVRSQGPLEFRPMREGDIISALQIIYEYDEDDAYDARETYEESVEGQFVLTEQGVVIGVVGAKPIEDTVAAHSLSWTYLRRIDRRSGKGGQMLQWILEFLREEGCRKVFVQASDYHSEEEGDIYFDARDAYVRCGFMQELRQPDFYAPGESMIVYGMRLLPKQEPQVEPSNEDIVIVGVDEIPETNEAYWIGWEPSPPGRGSKAPDFEKVLREVKSWGGRSVYLALPSDLPNAHGLLTSVRFRIAGRLIDYYEDGVDEVHYRYDL